MDARRAEGAALIALSALIWSGAGVFMRALDGLELPVIQFWRAAFGAASLYLLVLRLHGAGAPWALRLDWPRTGAAALCAAASLAYIAALKLTSVAEVMIVAATMPLLAAFIVWLWMGERPDGTTLSASLIALAGVAIMAGGATPESLLGDAVAFAMAALFAAQLAMTRRRPDIDMTAATAHGSVLIALFAAPMAGSALWRVGPGDLTLLLLFGATTTGLATALLFAGARWAPPAAAALILLLDNVLSPVWVWLIFGETPGRPALIGGGLTLAAVLFQIASHARSPRAGGE
jgi:drug/metabolite transporter (DMT)-like permease